MPSKKTDYFSDLVETINQQLSVLAADTTYKRLREEMAGDTTPAGVLRAKKDKLRGLDCQTQKRFVSKILP